MEMLQEKSALKNLEFHKHSPYETLLESANAEGISGTLRGLKPIGAELMEMWVDQRGF